MNYYYDLTLNFSNNLYKFYEWELEDNLINIKKITLYRIYENKLINLYKYNGRVEKSFLDKILDKTTYKDKGKIKTISYAVLFTDTKSAIALILKKDGSILSRSNLLLEDELNVIEMAYSLKKEKIIFFKDNIISYDNKLRIEEKMKEEVCIHLKKVKEEKDDSKLIYYHLEWFSIYDKDINRIYNKMISRINNSEKEDLIKIYNLINITSNNK